MQNKLSLVIQGVLLLAVVILIHVAANILAATRNIETAIYGWEEVYDVTEQSNGENN